MAKKLQAIEVNVRQFIVWAMDKSPEYVAAEFQSIISGEAEHDFVLGKVFQNTDRRFLSNVEREIVFQIDGRFCNHCGSLENLSIDHIIPYSLGGETTIDNSQVLCRKCNSKKGNRYV